jgi:hypothetical protein
VFADCLISGNGIASADIDIAGDDGICLESDLATNGFGDGSDPRVEPLWDSLGAANHCLAASGIAATERFSG